MKPFDLQVNGYSGVDFCSLHLTADQLHHACEELRADGVDGILATVITDSIENLIAKLSNLVRLRAADALAKDVIAGFHIEGPFMSAQAGYAGAHPAESMRPGSPELAKQLLDACDGLAKLITIAPECDPNFATTEFLVNQGVTVSAGHCNPSRDQLWGAIDHGLSLVTHFGNGCPVDLPRHDNVLQRFLYFREQLTFCFIPDGAHIDFFALKNYIDFVGIDRTIMVTDAIAAAKLEPGIHELSGMTVEVDQLGVARKPGSANLAGATITVPKIIENLTTELGLTEAEIGAMIDLNPRSALGF